MKKILILLAHVVLMLPCSTVIGGETASLTSGSFLRLSEELNSVYRDRGGYQLTISVRKGQSSIEFCPDNTCDEFKFSTKASLEAVHDFIYLFEFYVPTYYELEKSWKTEKRVVDYAANLVEKYHASAKCEVRDKKSIALCVIRYLGASQHISLGIVKYDEGKRISSPTTLEEHLKK